MRYLLIVFLLASCSVSKTASKDKKDSLFVSTTKEKISTDSIYTSTKNEWETADLVVVFKDSATGFLHWSGDSFSVPASAIKEIRQKKNKSTQNTATGSVKKDIQLTDEKKVKVSQKVKQSTKEKKQIGWWWIILTIFAVLLYISRKKIHAIF